MRLRGPGGDGGSGFLRVSGFWVSSSSTPPLKASQAVALTLGAASSLREIPFVVASTHSSKVMGCSISLQNGYPALGSFNLRYSTTFYLDPRFSSFTKVYSNFVANRPGSDSMIHNFLNSKDKLLTERIPFNRKLTNELTIIVTISRKDLHAQAGKTH